MAERTSKFYCLLFKMVGDLFRKIPKGHIKRHLGGGGGGVHIVNNIHFEGFKSPRGSTKFPRGVRMALPAP